MDLVLEKKIRDNKKIQDVFLPIMYSYKQKRDLLLDKKEKEEFKNKLRNIKEKSINNIKNLKKKAIDNLQQNGIKVIEAKDSNEANSKIKEIIGKENLIIKSKSNTTNEIELNNALKDKELIETDLGDFLVQLFDGKDLHPVLPAVNLTPEKIASKIKEKLGVKVNPNSEDIVKFVRDHLREKIYKAKVGITGANVISSDGSVFILENEGNISLTSRIPDKHIIVSSFDKIVESKQDALEVVKGAGIFGTGQKDPMYVSIISGPSKTADIQNELITGAQGAKEVYLILLDNKRSEILDSDFKELLYCINCGACINFCPVYHQLFTNYGSKYFYGSKGVVLSYFRDSLKKAYESGAFYCTTCKQCKENCPVKIDLPNMILKIREDLAKNNIQPENNLKALENIKKYGNPFGDIKKGEVPDKLYCC